MGKMSDEGDQNRTDFAEIWQMSSFLHASS